MTTRQTKSQTPLSQILIPLFSTLDSGNHQFCVCGNYDELPYHTENDVDIWSKDTTNTINIIEQICNQSGYKIYLKNSNATGSNLFFYSNTAKGSTLIHLDVLQECRWHSFLPLVKSKIIEKHKVLHESFWVADKTIDAAMHLMYPLSHFGKVTPKYYADIIESATNEDFWEIVKDGWGDTFTQKIRPLIKNGLWSELEKEFANHKLKLTLYSLSKVRGAEIKSFFSFITSNIKRLIKPNGLFIAFIGPDGCGKTTIQNNLQPFFQKGFTKGKIKKFYWRPFLLPRIQALLPGRKRDIPDNTENEEPSARLELRNVGLCQRIAHCIKLFYYSLDYIFGRLKYQGAWSRGGVVCFDRYWGDLLVFPERFGINVPKWLVRLLGLFVPKPDIVFYLHAEPEVLIGRKPELPFEEMKSQIEQYKDLCQRYPNYSLINGDQPEEDVLADVIKTCLEMLAKRYPENR
ncbi:MAG: hypothetical protein OEY01_05170 [Desulfobulbaceae bacterium]|nr:hypothetical protein [Desulfobulbaceae bacterium]